ncbi:MAG: zinc dependent phospholipase C family protein [Clostridiales bacterium]
MADFTTHHILGQQVLAATTASIANIIENNIGTFCWGLQGPDLLYFHRAVVVGSPLPSYGRMIHGEKTADLFNFLANDIISHRKCLDFENLLSYYFGFCCHYALDSKIHPYVFSKQYDLEAALGHAPTDNSAHWHMESGIDEAIYPLVYDEKISEFNVRDYYQITKDEKRSVAGLYSRILWNVYGLRVQARDIETCFVDGIWINQLLYDKKGTMKPLAIMLQSVLKLNKQFKGHFKSAAPVGEDFLNLTKKPWYHYGEGVTKTDSVIDIMEAAKNTALELLTVSEKAIHCGNRHLITDLDFSRSFVDGKRK